MPIGCQDFRIYTAWRRHPKRLKLARELGPAGVLAIEDLWSFATESYPSGVLADLGAPEIEEAVGWKGGEGAFVEAIVRIRLLDELEGGGFKLHDWEEWQPYVVDAPARVEKARRAGEASARARAAQRGVQPRVERVVGQGVQLGEQPPSHPIRNSDEVPVHERGAQPAKKYRLRDTRGKG